MLRKPLIAVLFVALWVAAACGPGGEPEPTAVTEPASVRVAYRSEGVATGPEAAAWRNVPVKTLVLSEQNINPPTGGGTTKTVSVKAMHDGQWIGFRLEWEDPRSDREVGTNSFRDAAAIGFPARQSEVVPAPFMGDPERPVNIWQWTAMLEAEALGKSQFAERYPHTEGVWYFAQDLSVNRQVRSWRGTRPIIEYAAHGFGTLTRQASQSVVGASVYRGGKWRVVLRRKLATGYPEDTLFRPGETTHIIAAVWNGAREEVNGKKSITLNWTPLELDPTM